MSLTPMSPTTAMTIGIYIPSLQYTLRTSTRPVIDVADYDPELEWLGRIYDVGFRNKMTFERFLQEVDIGLIRFGRYTVRNPVTGGVQGERVYKS